MPITQQYLDQAFTSVSVLFVSQEHADIQTIRQISSTCPTLHLALAIYDKNSFSKAKLSHHLTCDLILLDGDLSDSHSLEQFHIIRRVFPTKPIIVISHNPNNDIAALAFQYGAQDYLLKAELNARMFERAIRHALKRHQHQLMLMQRTEALQQIFLELKQANQDLRQLATTDGLTHVYNRRHFNTALEQEWSRAAREKQTLSLILCDIDFFKAYNDTYGHRAGDRCLQQVAQLLSMTVNRPADIVARYGGEEFAIILPNTNRDGAFAVARKIHRAIHQAQIKHINSSVSDVVTMSMGVATQQPVAESEASALVEAADRALYTAKNDGRNGIHRSSAHLDRSQMRTHRAKKTPEVSPFDVAS